MENDEPAKNRVSLRIHSYTLTAEDISKVLNMEPDDFNVKDSKAAPSYPKSFVHKSHMWQLKSNTDETASLDQHLSRLVDFIESRSDDFKRLIADCEFDMFCGYFPNGWTGRVELSPELLRRLTIIPVKIVIKLYEPLSEGQI